MRLGEIFTASINDTRANFKVSSKLVFWFYVLPMAIVTAISIYWLFWGGIYDTLLALDAAGETSIAVIFGAMSGFFAGTTALSTIATLIGFLAISGLVAASLKKKKFSYSEALQSGKRVYLPLLGLYIVLILFLLGLYLLLIIPGIIFTIYWILSIFIKVDENSGVIESLRKSFYMIRGRWWRTLGYLAILAIVVSAVSLIFSIPSIITSGAMEISSAVTGTASTPLLATSQVISFVFSALSYLIIIPFSIFFLKNYYLELKTSSKKKA